MFAMAQAYLDQVITPGKVVLHSGLSKMAFAIKGARTTTLGAGNILRDRCILGMLFSALGSGIGSQKVTVFVGMLGSLLKMLLIFCSTTISSFPQRLFCSCSASERLPMALMIWFSGMHVSHVMYQCWKNTVTSFHCMSFCKKHCGSYNAPCSQVPSTE